MAPAFGIVTNNPPVVAIRRAFEISKCAFSFLDWRIFSRNNRNAISVNRP